MRKRFLLLGLLVLVLGFFGQSVLAKLRSPENLRNISVGEGSAKVGWTWDSGGGTINRFVLSYRIDGEEGEWTKKYPSASVVEYTIMGLTENTTYEWKILSEASDPNQNSDEAPASPDKITFTTLSGSVVVDPGSGTGQPGDGIGDGSPVDLFGPIQSQSLDDLFNTVINFLLVLAFVIGPLMIIYAGFLILTAAGDAKKMSKAKTIILWTLIALAIILFAKGLTSLVKGALSN